MGALLQLTGINDCNNKRYKLEQNLKLFIETPINIIKCISNGEDVRKFCNTLNKNIKYIIKGFRKAYNKYILEALCNFFN